MIGSRKWVLFFFFNLVITFHFQGFIIFLLSYLFAFRCSCAFLVIQENRTLDEGKDKRGQQIHMDTQLPLQGGRNEQDERNVFL